MCTQCAITGGWVGEGQRLTHSLRTGRLGLVPACVQPLPVGLNAGNEAKWTPVEGGEIRQWGEYAGKQREAEEN